MKKILPFLVFASFVVLLCLPSCQFGKKSAMVAGNVEKQDTVYPLGFCTDSFRIVKGIVRSGEPFSAVLSKVGLSNQDAYDLVVATDSLFDPKRLRAGNSYEAYYDTTSTSGGLKYLVYHQDKINMLVFHCRPPFQARPVRKKVDIIRQYADVTISSSLWNDMLDAEVSPLMIGELSDIYAWTIDFFSLQDGDRFRVLYGQKECEGEIVGIDSIYYAVFNHNQSEFPAIMYDAGEGGNLYWNEKGESLKKAFLKAPLKFKRISSGFSYHRKHPVTGKVRAHTGVDYAAPTGTPVMSIGDGTVISKGWGGGGGNTVKIRHNSVYTTAYLHLSRYANGLKVGDRVRQGDVIGYVGMTGTATGPHLDFRVWKNGTPINPLTMESPSVEPIRKELLPNLDSVAAHYRSIVDSVAAAHPRSADEQKNYSVRLQEREEKTKGRRI